MLAHIGERERDFFFVCPLQFTLEQTLRLFGTKKFFFFLQMKNCLPYYCIYISNLALRDDRKLPSAFTAINSARVRIELVLLLTSYIGETLIRLSTIKTNQRFFLSLSLSLTHHLCRLLSFFFTASHIAALYNNKSASLYPKDKCGSADG